LVKFVVAVGMGVVLRSRIELAPVRHGSRHSPLRGNAVSELHEHVRRLADLAAKTLHETERLRRDVAKLHGRIQPFDGEIPLPEPDMPEVRAKWPIPDALNMIERARASLLGCERELAAIRARIDSIERDAISREELKPWLRDH
jgi:hypothetical protein